MLCSVDASIFYCSTRARPSFFFLLLFLSLTFVVHSFFVLLIALVYFWFVHSAIRGETPKVLFYFCSRGFPNLRAVHCAATLSGLFSAISYNLSVLHCGGNGARHANMGEGVSTRLSVLRPWYAKLL